MRIATLFTRLNELQDTCGRLRVENTRLKDSLSRLQEQQNTLQRKYFKSNSLAFQMTSRISSLNSLLALETMEVVKRKSMGQRFLQFALFLIPAVRASARRIRTLTYELCDMRTRFERLAHGHLALRRRYLDLEGICIDSRMNIKRLGDYLEKELIAKETLILERKEQNKLRASMNEQLKAAHALSWTIISRYDTLQIKYSKLAAENNDIHSEYRELCSNLCQISSQIQDVFEVTELGLNELHQNSEHHLLKYKQNLLKVEHKLDLIRLDVAESLRKVNSVPAQQDAGMISFDVPLSYTPGSLEDAKRKLKTLTERAPSSANIMFVLSLDLSTKK